MLKTKTHQPIENKSISSVRIKELFALSSRLVDLSEELLEDNGQYGAEFISGLNESQRQAKTGRLTQINKLADLA